MSKAPTFRRHADLIIEAAIEHIFPLPDEADPRTIEATLAGYAGALEAIGAKR